MPYSVLETCNTEIFAFMVISVWRKEGMAHKLKLSKLYSILDNDSARKKSVSVLWICECVGEIWFAFLNKIVRESFPGEVTFKQRFEMVKDCTK